ncbi:MAG TPA: CHASE3 domain-containing protein, partial [Burkholderiaceae bacterium]
MPVSVPFPAIIEASPQAMYGNMSLFFPLNRRTSALLLVGAVLLSVSVVLFLWHASNELAGDYRAVNHSYAIVGELETLMGHVTDGETGERGFLITGTERYLEPYFVFINRIDGDFRDLKALAGDDPLLQEKINTLGSLLAERRAQLRSSIDARRARDFDESREEPALSSGKNVHDNIRQIVGAMVAHERAIIAQRDADVAAASDLTQRAMIAIAIGMASLAIALAFSGWRNRKESDNAAMALQAG